MERHPLIDEVIFAVVVLRQDATLWAFACGSLARDPLQYVLQLYDTLSDREPTADAVSEDAGGLHRGGIWELPPTLEDLPAGLVFGSDSDDFG